MPLLDVAGISRHFGGLAAVSDVSFQVSRGEILGLIGPNGAGKTTLFNLVSASLAPNAGKIIFKDNDITGLKPYRICRMGIARTFQTVKIFGNMTVAGNAEVGAYFGTGERVTNEEAARRAREELEFVGLTSLSEARALDLTLANQKRLEVARALATQPELLLLDEMMAGLTHTEVTEAMNLIRSIRERGVTVIIIEHVMQAIMSICDRIIVLHHGKKIAEGTPGEVAQSRTVIEVYLGEETNAGNT